MLEGAKVTLNGDQVTIPMHKTYGDGAVLTIENLGNLIYKLQTTFYNNLYPTLLLLRPGQTSMNNSVKSIQ